MDWLRNFLLFPVKHSGAVLASLACFTALRKLVSRHKLGHIPTYGVHHGLLGTYRDAYRFIFHAREVLEEGYRKFHGGIFKIPLPDRWMVVVTSPELIDQVRLAKSSDLSLSQLIGQFLAAKYTVGEEVETNPYHNGVLRSLTKQLLDPHLSEIRDEVVESFEELIPSSDDNWTPITIAPIVEQIVCRASNRLLVGIPLCHDPDWLDLNINYARKVFKTSFVLMLLPDFLKPVIGPLLSPLSNALQRGRYHLGDIIRERLAADDEFGQKYEGRPIDFVSCLLDHAAGRERTVDRIIKRFILIAMASVATTADVFTEALLNLIKYPHYAPVLREEIENAIASEGWSKSSLAKMHKLDSFLRETVRCEGISSSSVERLVINPAGFTFLNGIHVPYGTYISTPSVAVHHDERYYKEPYEFDGFRFCGTNKEQHFVTTSLDFLSFGHGRYACPGRFLAASELKIMLAHLLLSYDVTLDGSAEPGFLRLGNAIRVSEETRILIKRRKEC